MIYGYNRKTVEKKYGLREMREVTIEASPEVLRAVAAFLCSVAEELEAERVSVHWHRHIDDQTRKALGCDFIVTSANPDYDKQLPYYDG
jgi:hypothetical protein